MIQRRSVNGRPSGTDGSDFSYRMVVDSRYQKVALGKSGLCMWIIIQSLLQFLAVVLYLRTLEWSTLDKLVVYSAVVFYISLLMGELGRRRSRTNLLKLYLYGSSVTSLVSIACVLMSKKSIEVIKDPSRWDISNIELLKIVIVSFGVVAQIFAFRVANSLIHNMAPPRRAT